MHILVVGLGNPGEHYAHHRHNAGHLFVHWVRQHHTDNTPWRADSQKRTMHIRIPSTGAHSITIAHTRTFMNESGKAVHTLCKELRITDTSTLVVVHDDLDFPIGQWKLGFAKGPKLHNGITSVESSLHTDQFWRLRIGIEHRSTTMRMSGEAYVLQDFTTPEQELVCGQFPTMWQQILSIPT